MRSLTEKIKAHGIVELTLIDAAGSIKERLTAGNLVVNLGCNWIADQLSGRTYAPLSDIAIGAGTTAAVVADTALETSLATITIETGPTQGAGVDINSFSVGAVFLPGVGTGTVTEAGIFYGPALLNRAVFAGISKLATNTLTVNWKISFTG